MNKYIYDIYDGNDWERYEYEVETVQETYKKVYERYLDWFDWALELANENALANGEPIRTNKPIDYKEFCEWLLKWNEVYDAFYITFVANAIKSRYE